MSSSNQQPNPAQGNHPSLSTSGSSPTQLSSNTAESAVNGPTGSSKGSSAVVGMLPFVKSGTTLVQSVKQGGFLGTLAAGYCILLIADDISSRINSIAGAFVTTTSNFAYILKFTSPFVFILGCYALLIHYIAKTWQMKLPKGVSTPGYKRVLSAMLVLGCFAYGQSVYVSILAFRKNPTDAKQDAQIMTQGTILAMHGSQIGKLKLQQTSTQRAELQAEHEKMKANFSQHIDSPRWTMLP